MPRHYNNHPRNYEQLSLVGVKVGTGAINNEQGLSSASKSSIRRFVITEKAPTRAFS